MSTTDKTDRVSSPIPRTIKQYHVFLASPGDVSVEREHVRKFFERYNQTIAQLWNVRYDVVDWENYSTIGVGRPQELITGQTLEKYGQSIQSMFRYWEFHVFHHYGKFQTQWIW